MAYSTAYSFSTVDVLVDYLDNPNGSGETTVGDTDYRYLSPIRVAIYDHATGETTVIAEDATGFSIDTDGYIVLFKAPLDQVAAVHTDVGGEDHAAIYDIAGAIVVYDVYEGTSTEVTDEADFALGQVGGRLLYRGVAQGTIGDYDTLRYWVEGDPDPELQVDGETTELNRDLAAFTYTDLERDIVLFTRSDDEVSFNALDGVQRAAIAEGGDLTHAGDGADEVILPGSEDDATQAGFVPGSWFYGEGGNDTIAGGALADRIDGGAGNDTMEGGAEDDVLAGGLGKDSLDGGTGADRFVFGSTDESRASAKRDVVVFVHKEGDTIDLSAIDAGAKAGDQDFAWVKRGDLDAAFTGKAGELRFDDGILMGDVNGDGRADFQIEIMGNLKAGDVIL